MEGLGWGGRGGGSTVVDVVVVGVVVVVVVVVGSSFNQSSTVHQVFIPWSLGVRCEGANARVS